MADVADADIADANAEAGAADDTDDEEMRR